MHNSCARKSVVIHDRKAHIPTPPAVSRPFPTRLSTTQNQSNDETALLNKTLIKMRCKWWIHCMRAHKSTLQIISTTFNSNEQSIPILARTQTLKPIGINKSSETRHELILFREIICTHWIPDVPDTPPVPDRWHTHPSCRSFYSC